MKNLPDEVLDYVNTQIDTLTQKSKFSLGELTAVVDAAFALSGNTLSGSTVLVYVIDMRGLRIVLNADKTLTIVQRRSGRFHELPVEFKPSAWVVSNTQRLAIGATYRITPLFKLGMTTVVERDVVWLRQGHSWVSVETDVTMVQCDSVHKMTSVLFPANVGGQMRLVSLPSETFNSMVRSDAISFDISKGTRSRGQKPEVEVNPLNEANPNPVSTDPREYYQKFVETHSSVNYGDTTEHERTTLMHVLINSQMSRNVINRLIF